MNGLGYILAANIILWLAIFGFLTFLHLRFRKLKEKISRITKDDNLRSVELIHK